MFNLNKHNKNEAKFSIVYTIELTKKKYKFTSILLTASILLNTRIRDIHVVIPEERRTSFSEIPEIIRKYCKLHVVRNPLNKGWGWRIGCLGIETDYDRRLILDTDTVILKDFELKFLDNYYIGLVPVMRLENYEIFSNNSWEKYYSHFNVKPPSIRIKSQDGKELGYPVFDPGFVAIKDAYHFKNVWIDTIIELDAYYNIGPYSDMVALPIALVRYFSDNLEKYAKILDKTWCYHPRTNKYFIPKNVKIVHFTSHRVADFFLLYKNVPELTRINKVFRIFVAS